MPVGAQREPCQLSFVAIDGDRGVGRLVRVDSDRDSHEVLRFSVWIAAWTLLMKLVNASFEPHRDTVLTGRRFVR